MIGGKGKLNPTAPVNPLSAEPVTGFFGSLTGQGTGGKGGGKKPVANKPVMVPTQPVIVPPKTTNPGVVPPKETGTIVGKPGSTGNPLTGQSATGAVTGVLDPLANTVGGLFDYAVNGVSQLLGAGGTGIIDGWLSDTAADLGIQQPAAAPAAGGLSIGTIALLAGGAVLIVYLINR